MISGETKVVTLMGDPVEHSVSPAMQNAAFEELGIDYVYVAFKVPQESVKEAIEGIRALGLEGANVTIPHKSAVMKHLDGVDDIARKIGAVNTIKRDDGDLVGLNTDGMGALRALEEEIEEVEEKKVTLLGAGGAARAIAFTLVEAGGELTISNRTESKAKALAEEIEEKTGQEADQIPLKKDELVGAINETDILINSTSVGMHPNEDETLLRADSMHPDLTVMDIVYNPLRTKLLKEAEKAGADTIEGLGMLVHQGAASLEIWTGKRASIETMKKAARKAMEGK